ncbi:right-handed parallel beta-helix repeat-containing protein [Catenovulum adriaticum]|uniref:Right-handed parallel beta-helix repeat-containing protein n=1 Tax=Catenovulum adriaticum TaxID=2984846 RepID=A0ABY7ALF0_9ALTE|nr:right-handed parallel beta-helix repeat-containing protein [Catenovulum sp. TS8]WAJ70383.1 right-handed parallel beta-helix repeat-containing protein [Catenovulum sp. TS8]
MKLTKIMRITLVVVSTVASPFINAADYFVANNGDDSNDGSLSTPFLTLSKAAEIAVAGDTVNIRAGVYNEILRPANSGTESNPIVFQSYQDEKVVITAMEPINGWSADSENIYVADVDWDLGQSNFVMQGRTAMDLARWPNNVDGDPFTQNSLRNTGGSASEIADNAYLDYDQGIPEGDWSKGGSIYFYGDKPGSGWTTWRAFITSNTSNRVYFDLNKNPSWIRTFHAPADKGDFFLQGIKAALDYQNEWYFDAENKKLYVYLPEGSMPTEDQVQMRKREKTIDLSARNHIHIKNLAVFGGSIEITNGASNNHIYAVTSLYGNYTLGVVSGFASGSQSINIRSDWNQFNTVNNVIEKSEIGFGSGTGIYDSGERTQILDSYIHDFNYLGNYDAIINARGGNHTKVLNNTITRAGRDAIQGFNDNAEYAYNDISYSNLIADDCGLFYTVGGPSHTEIHHNWLHDAYSSGSKSKAAGIYLDNDAEGFDVHHNVIWNTEWSNIQINWDGTDLNIYNNTLWNGSATMGAWHKEGTSFSNVKVWNNLSDKNSWEPQSDKQNNVTISTSPFVDYENGNFQLKAGTAAVDAGKIIPDFTDDVTDGKPDVGAYEINGDNAQWVAGITWEQKLGPTGNGCYGLPGESCIEPITEEPTANFAQDANIDENQTITIKVILSDYAMNYPVTIPYTISGTAQGQDHNLNEGSIVIEAGKEASLSMTAMADDQLESDETLVITMGALNNAIAGDKDSITLTIKDKTVAPEPEVEPEEESKSSGGGSTTYWTILSLLLALCLKYYFTHFISLHRTKF